MSLSNRLRARWHYWLGLAQRSRGNRSSSIAAYEDAIAEFTQAIELHPDFAMAHYARGVVYWRELNDYARAVRDFTRALELNPRISDAYLNRGLSRVYGQLGTREEILTDFERYLQLGGSAAEARLTALGIPFDRHIGQLSGGQQAQVALSLALAKRPRVLLLDEPVAGLDPLARNHFLRALVTAAREETLTVVLSSHVLAELEQICDYLVLLNHGRIQLAAQVAAVLEQHRTLGPQIQTDPGAALIGTVPDGRRVIRVPIGESGPGQRSTLEEVVLAYLAAAPFTKEAGRTGA